MTRAREEAGSGGARACAGGAEAGARASVASSGVRACARGAGHGGELSSARGRAAEGREEGERERKKKMENEKEKGEEREEREGETRAGADRGDDRGAGQPRSAVLGGFRERGHRERGRGLEIGRLEQRKIPGIRVQGSRRILSSTMKSFWKKIF